MIKIEVELTFPSKLRDVPIIYHIGKKFKVIPNIYEASFSTETGWVYLSVEGEEKEIERLFNYLRLQDVIIDIRK